MESEKRTLSIEEDLELIVNIIKENFDLDIFDRRRKAELVNVRFICAKLLYEKGHTFVTIGKAMKKDHSTIIYYVKNLNNLILQIENLRYKYNICKDIFFKEHDDLLDKINRNHYRDEIYLLKKQLSSASKNINRLSPFYEKYKRLEEIILLVNERTKEGNEYLIKKKINAMFNTIQK
jgi:hypothetical protein